ncbi:hypothetical protein V8G54_027017 [Vigna mungo]|uniref:Protein kinase domain-containing protein n=1 Tax=Vigna mungo TaxID=3915 RepID=A0AAQ3RQ13_VIGMU
MVQPGDHWKLLILHLAMTCFPLFFSKSSSSARKDPEIDEGIHNVKLYSYKELRNATDDFSQANKIGEGGFGSVYKGRLKDGKVAAIKVLAAESRQGVKEFLTEINVISEIEHENLVKLYGCKISIGIARGLAYLHEEVRPHIVHRDIKASNILLDKDLTPKISDFGLAKLIPANMTHVSTRVAGTIGYLAPEYAIGGKLTRKADVYSFGVLLVEIVSGRSNTNTRLPLEEQFLLERLLILQTWELYERKELVGLVDTSLDGEFDAEQACKFMKIGLLCTQESPKLRPSMSSVVKMLTGKIDVDDSKITKPALISDFMDLKVRRNEESSSYVKNSSTYDTYSSSDNHDTTMSSATTTTFAAVYDESM